MNHLNRKLRLLYKQLRFWMIAGGAKEERDYYRRMRLEAIRTQRSILREDLLNRHRIGDIILEKDDIVSLEEMRVSPVFAKIEKIYTKYL